MSIKIELILEKLNDKEEVFRDIIKGFVNLEIVDLWKMMDERKDKDDI
ncbi:hypothetical protein [Anaerophilus nitritogenes]|nr:hypothetical protein [Anaerophilus nitritogenes]